MAKLRGFEVVKPLCLNDRYTAHVLRPSQPYNTHWALMCATEILQAGYLAKC